MTDESEGVTEVRAYVETRDGSVVVRLSGELDVSNVEQVREQLKSALTGDAPLVFDLEGLQFMDSSGIALLLSLGQQHGGTDLRRASSIIKGIVEATGIGPLLRIVDD